MQVKRSRQMFETRQAAARCSIDCKRTVPFSFLDFSISKTSAGTCPCFVQVRRRESRARLCRAEILARLCHLSCSIGASELVWVP